MQSSSQQHDTLLRRRAPDQLYKPRISPALIPPSSHSSGPTRHFFPLPAPPSSAYAQTPGSHFVPSSQSFSNSPYVPPQRPQHQSLSSSGYFHAVKPQNAFVAIDPFRVSHWNEQVDASSDELTFDDIQVRSTGSAPGPKIIVVSPLVGNLPNNASSHEPYGQDHGSTQSNISSVPASHIYGDTSSSTTPSIHHSAVVGQKYGDTVTHTSIPAFPINPPSTSCTREETPYNPYYPQYTDHGSFSGISYPPQPQRSGPLHQPPELPNKSFFSRLTKVVLKFVLITFPTQMYLYILLRLPSLYFSRVAQIFEEADMTLPEIKKMALEMASQGLRREFELEMAFESCSVPPAYRRLTSVWESFIDSLMREWKTLNIISVLLLTAILTILQIQSAAEDPLTKYTALISLMCSLISLLFGCMYIIRFGSMRKTYKAAEWALEVKRTKTLIWWNVWVLLAMPAIWSVILYITCVMSFVWRSGLTSTTPPEISNTELLAIRIIITAVLGTGVIYGCLIANTFHRYGVVMDKAWRKRISKWIEEKDTVSQASFTRSASDNPCMTCGPFANDSTNRQPSFGDGRYTRDS